jgi:hypothetical protein
MGPGTSQLQGHNPVLKVDVSQPIAVMMIDSLSLLKQAGRV